MDEHAIHYIEKVKLDNKDKKILKVLDRNARLSISGISKKTGIPRDSVLYRIKRMQKLKVIRFFHPVLDPNTLGYPVNIFVNFVLQNLTEKNEQEFLSFLNNHPNITYVAKTTGKWDFTISIAAKNLKHFDNIIRGIRIKFPKMIKEYETASIIEEYKYDYMFDLIR